MARHCSACGLPLDPENHDQVRLGKLAPKPILGWRRGRRIKMTHAVTRPLKRIWLCRVKPVYDSPATGKTFDAHPGAMQRIEETNARYVRV